MLLAFLDPEYLPVLACFRQSREETFHISFKMCPLQKDDVAETCHAALSMSSSVVTRYVKFQDATYQTTWPFQFVSNPAREDEGKVGLMAF